MNPFATLPMMRAGFDLWRMTAEAQMVVGLRLWGMAGAWALPPGEALRMVSEKGPAWTEAWTRMGEAAMTGVGPVGVLSRGTSSLARPVRANRRRLTRRATKR